MRWAKKAFLFVVMLLMLTAGLGMTSQAASKVKLSKTSATLYVSKTLKLKVTGTSKKVTWSSSNKKVAKVSSSGKVTAVKAGTAKIKAKVNGKTYVCKVTVKKAALSKTSVSIALGSSTTVKLNGATIKSVKSSKKSVATVTKKGKITAKGVGSCKITFTAKNGKKYTCKVTVTRPVTGIALSTASLTLDTGSSQTITATVSPANATNTAVSYSSSNTAVATVDTNGKITAVSAGTATITVTAQDGSGKSAAVTVTVLQKVTGITLSASSLTLDAGSSQTITATVRPANASNKAVSYSSSNTAVATVDSNGKVTAVAAGTATITVTAQDGSGKSAAVTVTVLQKVTGITLSASSLTLDAGSSQTITATVSPANASNKAVSYSSSNAAVATVDSNGKITAVSVGTATITVAAQDGSGVKAACTVTVPQKATAISLDQYEASLEIDETVTLTATISPDNTYNKSVNWSSSNEAVATVTGNGNQTATVTAVGAGTATITATTADGTLLSDTCEIAVAGISANEAVVTSQAGLDTALSSDLEKITIQTNSAVSLTIGTGTYSSTELVVNAPNAEVTNSANFSRIVISAVAENTFIEKASGNTIIWQAAAGRIEVAEGASTALELNATVSGGNPSMQLVNNGTVSSMTLNATSDVVISGSQTSTAIPVTATENAAGSRIETSQNLALTAGSKVDLVLNSGAEETTATVSDTVNIPNVSGLGSVTVYDTAGTILDTVVAENTSGTTQEAITVSGKVTYADNTAAAGASVYLTAYSSDIDTTAISSLIAASHLVATTGEDGSYSFETQLGNYYLTISLDGYKTNVQTLVITSVNSGAYANTTIVMAEADADTYGTVTGVLTDAYTGNAISYSVVLKIRNGSNNVSGTALQTKTVAAADSGAYTFDGLEAGAYTIQVLNDENGSTAIMATSFNVTVVAGTTVTGNFTITPSLESDQIRFVLTWGAEGSGAPSDLDSHLVGPTGDGISSFHTWFSEMSYYYGETMYDGLDVDDVTYEGPETTTVYVKTSGTYSFYVYDYSDQDDEDSTIMSNKSSAIVNVYEGSTLRATYYIPTGQSGNLWHVCDYDAATGVITGVNTVGYWPSGGSSTVGQSSLDILKNSLNNYIGTLENYVADLADGTYKSNVEAALGSAKTLYQNSTDEDAITSMIATLSAYVSEIENAVHITGISGDNVLSYDYWSDSDSITVYGTAASIGDITVTAGSNDGGTVTVNCADVSGEAYVKTVTVTNTSVGLSRIWYVYYVVDNSGSFIIHNLTGDEVTGYDAYRSNSYGEIYIYGTASDMPSFTLTLDDGVSYEVLTDEYGSTRINMTYGDLSYTYYVYYSIDTSIISVYSITGNGIVSSSINQYGTYGEIALYGTEETIPSLTLSVENGVTYTVDTDAETNTAVAYLTYRTLNYPYYITYSCISTTELTLNEEVSVVLDSSNPAQYFTFTPTETATYTFKSYNSSNDPYGYLYQNAALLTQDDDGNEGLNFAVTYELEAGTTYMFRAAEISEGMEDTYTVILTKTDAAEAAAENAEEAALAIAAIEAEDLEEVEIDLSAVLDGAAEAEATEAETGTDAIEDAVEAETDDELIAEAEDVNEEDIASESVGTEEAPGVSDEETNADAAMVTAAE
ncbi:MAG: Ig-like domain-containing protein [Lachnospiraceae bacterium]|nr:Ig-like domain-containing protein [Lachnospiraceae bacterium]